jgi:hypothetical protein
MPRKFLLPESVAREDGAGAEIALDTYRGKSLLITLDIDLTVAQESLEISVWGSQDKRKWMLLQTFPQKFYCGNYTLPLDLTHQPEIGYLRAQWRMNRWGAVEAPLFGFSLAAKRAHAQTA